MTQQPTAVAATPAKRARGPYFWGRLFVRAAMRLAILCLVATAVLCLQRTAAMRRKLAAHAFRPTPALTPAMQQAEAEYKQALELLAEIYPATTKGETWNVPSPERIRGEAELREASAAAKRMRANVDSLRNQVLADFNGPADGLVDGLQNKVGRVREGLADRNQDEVGQAEERIQQLVRRMDPAVSFYGPMDTSEYRSRVMAVDSCRDFLEILHAMTKSASAHAMMERCNLALIRIRDAFPEPLSELVVARLNRRIDEERAKIAALTGADVKMKGEEMGHRLNQLKLAVNQAFAEDWKIDNRLDELDAALDENRERAEERRRDRQDILREAVLGIGWSILAGLCFAFFLLVCGDFLRAHFDTAEHTAAAAQSQTAE